MTDGIADGTASQSTVSSSVSTNTNTNDNSVNNSQAQQAGNTATPSEKLIPESRVNEIVSARLREERAKHSPENATQNNQPQQNSQQGQRETSTPILTEEQVRQAARSELEAQANQFHQQRLNEEAKQITGEFVDKMKEALSNSEKFPDFEQKVAPLRIDSDDFRYVMPFINTLENASEVMYEFGNNPHKLAEIYGAMRISPEAAYQKLQMLSKSIKQNDDVKDRNFAKPPIKSLDPSLAKTDNGKMTVTDYRSVDWLRR